MEYLFNVWDKLRDHLAGRSLLLLLDYDGTLTPIVRHPDEAILSKKVKSLLRALSKTPKCHLGIISGRALKDIKRKIGLKGIIYVGNHGLEVTGPGIKLTSHLQKRFRIVLEKIEEGLKKNLAGIRGIFLEDKDATLSIHYRLADTKGSRTAKGILQKAIQPYLIQKKLILSAGKKVMEVRPNVPWDKGRIAKWLIEKHPFKARGLQSVPIYIGDDVTDEDAFHILRNKGITIFVGRKRRSSARYYLKDTFEVERFLRMILELLREKHAGNR
jgi:trehalose-phosphatase